MINFYDTNIGSGSGNFIEQFDYVKDDTKLSNTSVIIPFYQKHTEFEFSLNFNAKVKAHECRRRYLTIEPNLL